MYVDGDGSGEGLIGFGDTVLDVRAVANDLYILVDDTHPVKISDVTARGYFSSVQTSDIGDMRGVGFSFVSDFPTGFEGRQGTLTVSTQYAQSSNTYTAARISDENTMDLVSAINYAIDYLSDKADESTGGNGGSSSDAQATGVETFYVNSDYGIEIDGQVYSIGDAINYDDYFQDLMPSGILNSYKYKEDERIDFTHVSYTGAVGQLTVTELSGYVQGLQTNTDFKFRGFEKGMTSKEVKWGLGYKVSAKDAESHPVFDSNIVVDGFKKNTYFCHVGDLNVELRMSKDVLSEIYIEQNLEFV